MKYVFGEFELNPASRELLRNGSRIALRPRSLECLVYLIEHRDRAVGRDELIAAVWGKVDAGDTVVAQTLLRARKALDDTGSQQGMIRTLPRFGYQWVAPIREVPTLSLVEAEVGGPGGEERVGHDAEVASSAAGQTAGNGAGEDVAVADEVPGIAVGAAEALPPPRGRRGFLHFGLLAFVMALAISLGAYFHRDDRSGGAVSVDDAVLVMPVAVVPMDSESAWVRLGAMDYMAARLRSSGINVLPSEQALRLGTAIEGDAADVARKKLLALSGAHWIAMPEMRRERGAWTVRLRVFDAGNQRTIDAHGETPLAAAAEAADAWLRQLGEQGKAGPRPGALAERLHRIDAEILGGRLTEARRLVRSASPAERNDPRFLLREGKLEFRAANFDEAALRFQAALDQAPQADLETRVGALLGLGNVGRSSNDLDAAESRYTQVLALLESLPADRVNSRMRGIAYQGRGVIRAQRGDLEGGVKDMGQARVWLQRSGDLITLAVVGHNLGKAEALRGDYLQALHEFDRSIETFERFRVSDYLANSLHEKAEVQLTLARPLDARETIDRVDAVLPTLEDDGLAATILMTKARTEIALGRLREADAALAGSRSRGVADTDAQMLELRLRLHLARGEIAQARQLAARPSLEGAGGGLLLAGVQAALRARDLPLAKAWLAAASAQGGQGAGDFAFALPLARALVSRASGDPTAALAQAQQAALRVGARDSPDSQIQAGVLQAMVLLDTRQHAAASALMGELEKYSDADYRVAWVLSRLYQVLGDAQAAASARGLAQSLAGERAIAIEPVL